MKCGAIIIILFITSICSSVSHNLMGIEIDRKFFRKLLDGQLAAALPEPASKLWSFIGFIVNINDHPASTNDIMKKLNNIENKIKDIGCLIELQLEKDALGNVEFLTMFHDEREINRIVLFIDDQFTIMQSHARRPTQFYKDAERSTSNNPGHLRENWLILMHLLNPRKLATMDLLEKVYEITSRKISAGRWCDSKVSLNEYIYRKYKSFMQTIEKGYTMMEKSYEILAQGAPSMDEYDNDVDLLRREYHQFKSRFSKNVAKLIAQSSVSIRRCDPLKHERGKTFLEFEKLMQGYIARIDNVGNKKCKVLGYKNYYGVSDFTFDFYTKCNGWISDCEPIYVKELCPTKSPSRRFDGVKTLKGDLGKVTSCENKGGIAVNNTGIFSRPTTCRCYCDGSQFSIGLWTIYSEAVFSNYEENMVITGLRLVNHTLPLPWSTLRLEIQQGKLGPYGYIDPSSVEWQKPYSSEYSAPYLIELFKEDRSINLNAVKLPPGFAMIGVKFTHESAGPVQMRIYARPISYDTGKILDYGTAEEPYSIHDPKKPKSELEIFEPTIPSFAAKNVRVDGEDKFIKLQPSDWVKDAAQTVVPFMDIQEVVTDPPTLLGGVGFAYRTKSGYGGFLGLELQSWNYTNHVMEVASNGIDLL